MTVIHDRQENTPASQTRSQTRFNELVTKLRKTREIGKMKGAVSRRSERNQKESPLQASIVVRPELEQMFLFFLSLLFFLLWRGNQSWLQRDSNSRIFWGCAAIVCMYLP